MHERAYSSSTTNGPEGPDQLVVEKELMLVHIRKKKFDEELVLNGRSLLTDQWHHHRPLEREKNGRWCPTVGQTLPQDAALPRIFPSLSLFQENIEIVCGLKKKMQENVKLCPQEAFLSFKKFDRLLTVLKTVTITF